MIQPLKAPFPYSGGKRLVAPIVWEYLGDCINYVEPFFGSGAVLLNRPTYPRTETVNDKDCYLANFYRCFSALRKDPESKAWEQVAEWADWPVNEADLHARHLWLVQQTGFQEKMKTDPEYYDAKIAGYWVWGISQWIGGGWCVNPEWRGRAGASVARGIHRKRQILRRGGSGVHRTGNMADPNPWKARPAKRSGGIHQKRPWQQMPDLGGDSGATGRGVHRSGLCDLYAYFEALAERLRKVRVCCGDWKRVLGPSPTFHIGTTAVFLDPPYSKEAGRDMEIYAVEDGAVAHEVREWAIANGENPLLRIALCGYEGEHKMPDSWICVPWKANGGYSNVSNRRRTEAGEQENRTRERVWFSPHCLKPKTETQTQLI